MRKSLPLLFSIVLLFATTRCTEITDSLARLIPEPMTPIITVADYAVNSVKPAYGDTLYVGDTLQISVALDPCYNTIQRFDVEIDKRYMRDSILFLYDYLSFCDTIRSKPDSGIYYFKDMVPSLGVFVPRMQFIAEKSPVPDSTRIPITISLTTDVDSTKVSNVCTHTFEVLILDYPEITEDDPVDARIEELIRRERKRLSGNN